MLDNETLRKSLFVIPSINGAHLLKRMLPTLRIPAEIVLVLDQGSTDDTEDVCRQAGVGLLQLGVAHTYTKACNLGARLARERGAQYLFVANNDIAFTTDVARELLGAMADDPQLGIVAPAQIIVNEATGERLLAHRVFWSLDRAVFQHDFAQPNGRPKRLEADFCELTLALVRLSILDEVGFLDDDFGFYHEDADFCFRLREAGYSCAYLPDSQIEHFASSTFAATMSASKQNYLARNKRLFAAKHLGYGVNHADHRSGEASSWNVINRNLHPHLRRLGLIDEQRPKLIFSHPGTAPFDYLYSVWETDKLPAPWLAQRDKNRGIMVPSQWCAQVFRDAGFPNVSYAPHGVEPDVHHPWGPAHRLSELKTFLWFSTNQHRKGLDVALKAWAKFYAGRPRAKFVVMGHNLAAAFRQAPDQIRATNRFRISDYFDLGVSVYEMLCAINDEDIAMIYRSVDFTVSSSRSEGFGLTIAESLACGTPAIFGDYGATREFAHDGALTLRGAKAPADYSDKGFADVGDWWEPDVDHLADLLAQAQAMDDAHYRVLSNAGLRLIRQRFTWRNTAFAIRAALASLQERRPPAQAAEPAQAAIAAAAPVTAALAVEKPRRKRKLRRWAKRAGQLRQFSGLIGETADRWERAGSRAAIHHFGPHVGAYFGRSLSRTGGRALSRLSRLRERALIALMPFQRRAGVAFIGYVEAGLGLGESLRANIAAVARHGSPDFAIIPFGVGVETRLIGPFMPEKYDPTRRRDVNVMEVACDQVPTVFQNLDPRLYERSYNVLRGYWELPKAPPQWAAMLEKVHEIWAPNDFVAGAFRDVFQGPIRIVPPCVEPEQAAYAGRAELGLDDGRFYFLFSFDYFSSAARKNPLGVVEAFSRAFPDLSENVGLVVKSIGAVDHYPEVKARIRTAARADPRIKIIDCSMTRAEIVSLIRACDGYVSLHRAEGFGLGIAEAMYFGKAVIGTDFSGSADFLSDATGFPVRYALRPLAAGEYAWGQGQSWAEPDIDAASAALRRAFADEAERNLRAAAGAALMREKYSAAAVARAMEARYREIMAQRRHR